MISAELADILIGVIMMTMVGLAAGNYATSIIYRLPRQLKIANDPPYCDSCRAYLSPRDLFPFFSWVFNKGKCRFCGVVISGQHAVVELSAVCLFNATYFTYGLGDGMITVIVLGMFLIILAAIAVEQGRIYTEIYSVTIAAGAVHRTLMDATIVNFIQGAYLALMAAIVLWGLDCLRQRKKTPFPEYALAICLGGLIVGRDMLGDYLLWLLPLTLIALLIPIIRSKAILIGASLAAMLVVFGVPLMSSTQL